MVTALTILFVIICFLLIFMVVITPSQEGGLASAFGGMGADSFFGTKAQRHINRFTVFLATSFLVLAALIAYISKEEGPKGPKSEHIKDMPAESEPAPEKK